MIFDPPTSARERTGRGLNGRARQWVARVAIFALISGSTGAILLCACDHPGGRPLAELQIVIAFLLGGLAVFLIYRELEQRSDSTGFMKACGAVAFVAAAIYIELKVAVRCVEWLARP